MNFAIITRFDIIEIKMCIVRFLSCFIFLIFSPSGLFETQQHLHPDCTLFVLVFDSIFHNHLFQLSYYLGYANIYRWGGACHKSYISQQAFDLDWALP